MCSGGLVLFFRSATLEGGGLLKDPPVSVILGSMEQRFVHAECVYPIQQMILDHSLASLGAAAGEVHTGA